MTYACISTIKIKYLQNYVLIFNMYNNVLIKETGVLMWKVLQKS